MFRIVEVNRLVVDVVKALGLVPSNHRPGMMQPRDDDPFKKIKAWKSYTPVKPTAAKHLKNGWLEDDPFFHLLLNMAYLQGQACC